MPTGYELLIILAFLALVCVLEWRERKALRSGRGTDLTGLR